MSHQRPRDERGEMGNPIGNGIMSCGCLLMLIPILFLLLLACGAVMSAPFVEP